MSSEKMTAGKIIEKLFVGALMLGAAAAYLFVQMNKEPVINPETGNLRAWERAMEADDMPDPTITGD